MRFSFIFVCLTLLCLLVQADDCNVVPTSQEQIRIIVPLYVAPGSAWDELIAANQSVQIIAIINPDSGPDPNGPGTAYTAYMSKLKESGILQIGYVHTSYGSRSLSEVEDDVTTYATKYAGLGLQGIFVDEAASSLAEEGYYEKLFKFILNSNPAFTNVFINPGDDTVEEYLEVSTNIMIYEDPASLLPSTNFPEWVLCTNSTSEKSDWQYRFSGIAYGASLSQVSSLVTQFHNKGIGYVYITDGAEGCCTYNQLASYFTKETQIIESLN